MANRQPDSVHLTFEHAVADAYANWVSRLAALLPALPQCCQQHLPEHSRHRAVQVLAQAYPMRTGACAVLLQARAMPQVISHVRSPSSPLLPGQMRMHQCAHACMCMEPTAPPPCACYAVRCVRHHGDSTGQQDPAWTLHSHTPAAAATQPHRRRACIVLSHLKQPRPVIRMLYTQMPQASHQCGCHGVHSRSSSTKHAALK